MKDSSGGPRWRSCWARYDGDDGRRPPPTELAVNWVMRVADSGGNGKLDVNDCEKAIKLYAHYLRTKDQVDRIFAPRTS